MATIHDYLSISFNPQEMKTIEKALASIKQVLKDKVVNLTPEERRRYGSINNNTEDWITKIEGYMEQSPEMTPVYIKKAAFYKDIKARKFLQKELNDMASINETMVDTAMLLSADIYNTAIAYYRNLKLTAREDVPGSTVIYQDLREQFPGRPSEVPELSVEEEEEATQIDLEDQLNIDDDLGLNETSL